jgi:hypothetical protein
MAETNTIQLFGKVIGAIATVAVAIITGVFSLHQTPTLQNATQTTQQSVQPQAPPPTIVVAPNMPVTVTNNFSTSKPKPGAPVGVELARQPQHQLVNNPAIPDASISAQGICDAGPHRVKVKLAVPVMPGANLYADDQVCKENVASEENMVIFLPQGTHHLVLKRGSLSCSADATLPLPNDPAVIFTCQ